MYGNNTHVIIDALVEQIKSLKLTILVKESEIEQLKKERKEKEANNG